jgi:endogenous inhibitor of DNA gyrase (YacG/DUF329 family)
MYVCLCCNFSAKNNRSLAAHIKYLHLLSNKEYYDTYIKSNTDGVCPICNKETSFRGGKGYLKYCSIRCASLDPEKREKQSELMIGKRQSQETIKKRIDNTDQNKKEENRKNTMLSKYNSLSTDDALSDKEIEEKYLKISQANKGKLHSKEHHEKVINSKRLNGTLLHSEETKRKISEASRKYFSSDNPPITLSESKYKGRGHKCGYISGLYFRSSYEETFIKYCIENSIKIESAETKEFRIQYEIDGKNKMYYPDFYLPDYDVVVEIKPLSLLDFNMEKIDAACFEYSYVIITEEELADLDNFFNYLS